MSRTSKTKQHFVNWLSQQCGRFGEGGVEQRHVCPMEHPLATYFALYKTVHGNQMDYALIGKTKWTAVSESRRQCRQLNQWQQDFCRKYDAAGSEGAVTWEEAYGLALGTLTSKQRRGRRTTVQLTLPLIWKRQTKTRVTRSIPTTG